MRVTTWLHAAEIFYYTGAHECDVNHYHVVRKCVYYCNYVAKIFK